MARSSRCTAALNCRLSGVGTNCGQGEWGWAGKRMWKGVRGSGRSCVELQVVGGGHKLRAGAGGTRVEVRCEGQ